jgi:hypothetical protein
MARKPVTRFDLKKRLDLRARLAMAGVVLAVGLASAFAAAEIGVVHLGAGEMGISLGKGEEGLTMNIDARSCPPNCGVDVNWRPLLR